MNFEPPLVSEEQQKAMPTASLQLYATWGLSVLADLLDPQRWSAAASTQRETDSGGSAQQQYPRDDSLVLLRCAEEGVRRGDGVFNMCRRSAYMALVRPAAFAGPFQDYSCVVFCGWRKADLALGQEMLWSLEDGLMEDLLRQRSKSIHFYVVLPLADGRNYVNVVVGRRLAAGEAPIALMAGSQHHLAAVAGASPLSYSWVRIASGTITGRIGPRDGEEGDAEDGDALHVQLSRMLSVDFGEGVPPQQPQRDPSEAKEDGPAASDRQQRCPYAGRCISRAFVARADAFTVTL